MEIQILFFAVYLPLWLAGAIINVIFSRRLKRMTAQDLEDVH